MVRKKPYPKPPESFVSKKAQILSAISVPSETYTDKSPKGSIDAPIIDLIQQINDIEGLVTTSSCSGRVAVFVEGPKTDLADKHGSSGIRSRHDEATAKATDESDGGEQDEGAEVKALTGSPAGKGGGHWLYVSHDPVSIPSPTPSEFFTKLCGLSRLDAAPQAAQESPATPEVASFNSNQPSEPNSKLHSSTAPRLIKLSFSPLILHVLCANLQYAKDLLAATINSGFRESGVQSLKALDDPSSGTMLGIRTMGLAFETVVGVVRDVGDGQEVYEALVDDEYLKLMFGVVNERFEWNRRRRRRLSALIEKVFGAEVSVVEKVGEPRWEDKEVRRLRKREAGLKRKTELRKGEEEGGQRLNGEDEFEEQGVLDGIERQQTSKANHSGNILEVAFSSDTTNS